MQQIWISCGQRLMRLTMNPPENLMLDPDIRHMWKLYEMAMYLGILFGRNHQSFILKSSY